MFIEVLNDLCFSTHGSDLCLEVTSFGNIIIYASYHHLPIKLNFVINSCPKNVQYWLIITFFITFENVYFDRKKSMANYKKDE